MMTGWLYSRSRDLTMLALPAAATLASVLLAARYGDASGVGVRAYAGWMAQFILGNSTHVILTFVLLAVRRDVLRATPSQATVVIAGALSTFVASFGFFWLTQRSYPSFSDFGTAVVLVFATHHTLSQAKGIWALYAMRARHAGLAEQSDLERRLQRAFVPLSLVLILVRWLFVEKRADNRYPFLQAVPGVPAILPYATTWLIAGVFAVFAALALRSLARPGASRPKILYVGVHLFGVGLTLLSPGWGAVLTAGVHGLEYFVLCGRMLAPLPRAQAAEPLAGRWVWPLMFASVAPLFVIGLVNAPFTPASAAARFGDLFETLKFTLNSIVMAHYFADAFIYRFRIPEVRRVALARLGFA